MNFADRTPIGMQNGLTIDNTAGGVALTLPTGAKARAALVTVYTAAIRFTVNGTAPTTTLGHRADVYEQIILESRVEVANFKAIREGSTSGSLEVTFYG